MTITTMVITMLMTMMDNEPNATTSKKVKCVVVLFIPFD